MTLWNLGTHMAICLGRQKYLWVLRRRANPDVCESSFTSISLKPPVVCANQTRHLKITYVRCHTKGKMCKKHGGWHFQAIRLTCETKGREHWQLRGHGLVEYKSESNNILWTYFRKVSFFWPYENRACAFHSSLWIIFISHRPKLLDCHYFASHFQERKREIMSVLPQEMAESAWGRESNLLFPDIHCLKVIRINNHSNLFSASQLLPFPSCQLHKLQFEFNPSKN